MFATSSTYKQLRKDVNATYEVQIVRGNVTYGMDKIRSCKIKQSLFSGSGIEIGNTVSSRCDLVIVERSENWPRMASFLVRVRLVGGDGQTTSEWLKIGTFYTDERSNDSFENLTVVAYDGMLTLEQTWTDKVSENSLPASWPITASQAANLLVEASGIQMDSSVVLDNTYRFFGLNTLSTVRESWAMIAAAMGGNCIITRDGKIKIIQLDDGYRGDSAIAGAAVAGIAIVDKGFTSSQQRTPVGAFDLFMSVQSFEDSDKLSPITGVVLETDAGTAIRAGTDTGYVVYGRCNFSNSSVVQLSLSNLRDFAYRPFSAGGTSLDPAAELGDLVIINGAAYPIITAEWDLNKHINCDISAPYDAEVDHEYRIETESAKNLKKALQFQKALEDRVYSSIEQTAEQIMLDVGRDYVTNDNLSTTVTQLEGQISVSATQVLQSVSETYTTKTESAETRGELESSISLTSSNILQRVSEVYSTKGDLASAEERYSSEIEQTSNSLSIQMNEVHQQAEDRYEEICYYIRYKNGVVIVGQSNSPSSLRISNSEVAMYLNDEKTTFWNQDKQRTPNQLEIPLGGSMMLGDFIFQPRSNGNMSLLWVGD